MSNLIREYMEKIAEGMEKQQMVMTNGEEVHMITNEWRQSQQKVTVLWSLENFIWKTGLIFNNDKPEYCQDISSNENS